MIKVVKPGMYTTIQNLGLYGLRKFGIPIGGCMDKESGALANMLVGNNPNNKLIEVTIVGPVLEFEIDVSIAITGADMSPMINGKPVYNNGVLSIKRGSTLSFGNLKSGCRAYIAIGGTLVTLPSAPLRKGDQICIDKIDIKNASTPNSKVGRTLKSSHNINVYPAPEFDLLTEDSKKGIFETKFTIHPDSNRMGYRTNGIKVNLINTKNILTSSMQPGTVQLPPNGLPIVLMRDCQTTGGYPRILQLSGSAINNMAQLKPGDEFGFNLIND